ncbi:UDP-glucose--hexose-1-phosphate uridylyltransferase [Alkalicoccus urumqiensis]|uniref:Galactose-1-phosphate uridylyltransferase n=1 Tax=Alkalicoccus urumqiensis TaxID=1548213 RepID=A0A2P6MI21_ALKUR|nr:UDP-glucose--hexose-1-phosphate uridylyltransferase [Alkalicoccus urumqiensis]PRO65932.1 UDP-glucose--hexose-1-phosphate uridylyltransferase [Alkalicoccus urumqiensis]
MNIDALLNELIDYAASKHLIETQDRIYCKNQLLSILDITESIERPAKGDGAREAAAILQDILDWAAENGVLEQNTVTERDLLDTKLMDVFAQRPSDVTRRFRELEREKGIREATAWFYEWCQDIHYIRRDRIAKNLSWKTPTEYGALDITINLSKPEKDPKEIQAAKKAVVSSYPLCLLCQENVGYAGHLNHPARQNLRTIPVKLADEEWHVQFSPYVYYHEHAIVLKADHEPMKITADTFLRLLDFVEQYPHYFIGSNADLPIVGGSILSHDHYQAGRYEFPMARAEVDNKEELAAHPGVTAGRVRWPMSVVRLSGKDKHSVVRAGEDILRQWKQYEDRSVQIIPETDGTPHHTITPIARMRAEQFELDLVLRSNLTSEEHPMGIYHPHEEVHHIKKENIGLIEVMGLAVLPGRLDKELELTAEALNSADPEAALKDSIAEKHAAWALEAVEKGEAVDKKAFLEQEVGNVFHTILHHAGVFKRTGEGLDAFDRFLHTVQGKRP